jgi:hypothetical protein
MDEAERFEIEEEENNIGRFRFHQDNMKKFLRLALIVSGAAVACEAIYYLNMLFILPVVLTVSVSLLINEGIT